MCYEKLGSISVSGQLPTYPSSDCCWVGGGVSCPDTDIDPKIVQNLEINCITKIKLPNNKSKRFKGLADSARFPENHSSTLFKSFHAG